MFAKRATLLSLGVLFAINVLNFYDRNVAGALAEPMRKRFGLNDTEIGLLGTVFILGSASAPATLRS